MRISNIWDPEYETENENGTRAALADKSIQQLLRY